MNRDRLDEMRETEAKEKQEQERLLKANPLMFYSTTQLKAELRRRKKESGRQKMNRNEIIEILNIAMQLLPKENEVTDELNEVIRQLEEEWEGEFLTDEEMI